MLRAEEVTAAVDSSGSAVTYAIPAPVTIPPDGSLHKVTIARFPLSPRLDFVSAPKLVPAAYRRARILNSSPYTLLPGEANIFVGDEYIGTTPLELTAPQGEIELYLGSEDRLKVERELKRRDVDKRLIGGRRHMGMGYEIKVENLLPYAAKLTLHDQFPVSRHEEIKVRLESADPKPVEVSEMNLLRWEFTLEPQEKRSVRFDFVVDSPQGMEVAGHPRLSRRSGFLCQAADDARAQQRQPIRGQVVAGGGVKQHNAAGGKFLVTRVEHGRQADSGQRLESISQAGQPGQGESLQRLRGGDICLRALAKGARQPVAAVALEGIGVESAIRQLAVADPAIRQRGAIGSHQVIQQHGGVKDRYFWPVGS